MAQTERSLSVFDQWLIAKTDGNAGKIIPFTAFISMTVQTSGKVVSAPLERGLFFAFNKVQAPTRFQVTLGCQGEPDELQHTVNTLTELQRGADTFSLISPEQEFKDLTLESYSYSRKREEGVNVLYVTLNLVQIAPLDPDRRQRAAQKPLEAENVRKADAADPKENTAAETVTGEQEAAEKKNPETKKNKALETVKETVAKIQNLYCKARGVERAFNELKSSVTSLSGLPNQILDMVCGEAAVTVHAFRRGENVFADVSIDNVLVKAGAICKNGLELVDSSVKDLKGSLWFLNESDDGKPENSRIVYSADREESADDEQLQY